MANITGIIKSVLGEVSVTRADGEQVFLKEGDILSVGDTVTTGAGGSAYIQFPGEDGQVATEGILQSDAVATLKESETGAEFEVAQGEFEILTEGDTVAVTGDGGMFGLFGAGLAAGGLAGPVAAAAGTAFALRDSGDDTTNPPVDDRPVNNDDGTPTDGNGTRDFLEPVVDATGPAAPAVGGVVDAIEPVTNVVDVPLETLTPVSEAIEPVLQELAPVTDALEPALTPVNNTVVGVLDGLSPVTDSLSQNLTPVTDAVGVAVSPVVDLLVGTENSLVPGLSDALPVNLGSVADQLAGGVDMISPQLADGVGQVVGSLEPVLTPVNDGLTQIFDAAQPVFDGLAPVTDGLPAVAQPVAEGLNQAFDALSPVTTPLVDALSGGLPTSGAGGGELGAPFDMVAGLLDPASLPVFSGELSLDVTEALQVGSLGTVVDSVGFDALSSVTMPVIDLLSGGLPIPGAGGEASGGPLDGLTGLLDVSSLPVSSSASPVDSVTNLLHTNNLPV